MRNIVDFLNESKEDCVYAVYMGDKTLVNFFYTAEEAEEEKNKLNQEAPGNKAFVKKESKKKIEK